MYHSWSVLIAIFGEDVGFGGVFRCSADLRDKYGECVHTCIYTYIHVHVYIVLPCTCKFETALSRDRLACLAPPGMVFLMYMYI